MFKVLFLVLDFFLFYKMPQTKHLLISSVKQTNHAEIHFLKESSHVFIKPQEKSI